MITQHGGPGVLEVQERPDPELGPGHVRIEVAACGINFSDVMARIGLYADAPKPPCVVGYEAAGTALELGDDGTIKPVVGGSFGFDEAGAAQTMITERRNVGKVVLVTEPVVEVRRRRRNGVATRAADTSRTRRQPSARPR